MTPNVFSVDLFVSKGADGSLLLDIHPDDNGWYNPESKSTLPVLPLSRERFPEFCSWLARQLEEKGGGALHIASFSVLENPNQNLTLVATPENVPQEEVARFLTDGDVIQYAHSGWNWNVLANIGALSRLIGLPQPYRDDLILFQKQMQIVLDCFKAKVTSC